MADLDKVLAKNIQKAKQKPRNFVIVAKGTTVLKLIVDRKRIAPSAVTEAKKECGGNSTISGVLTGGAGPELIFQVLELPSVTAVKLRTFILETTGLTLKPQFQVLAALTEVDDSEEEGSDEVESSESAGPKAKSSAPAPPPSSPPPPSPSASSSPGPPPSPPPSSPPPPTRSREPAAEQEAVRFNDRFKRLLPAIKRASDANLPSGSELKSLANDAGALAKKQDFAKAFARLDDIDKLLKEPIKPRSQSKESPTGEMPQPPPRESTGPKPVKPPRVNNDATTAATAFEAARKSAAAQVAKLTTLLDNAAKVSLESAQQRMAKGGAVDNGASKAAAEFVTRQREVVSQIAKIDKLLDAAAKTSLEGAQKRVAAGAPVSNEATKAAAEFQARQKAAVGQVETLTKIFERVEKLANDFSAAKLPD